MDLVGSCHCGKVRFTVRSNTPVPFMYCYCSICRKAQGGSGACVNIMGQNDSLVVTQGQAHVREYIAVMNAHDPPDQHRLAGNHRHFCSDCASMLWAYDPKYPEWCYPFASAIDTELPKAEKTIHIMQGSKASWVPVPLTEEGSVELYDEYPPKSIEQIHKENGWWVS
ncbi:MAG: Mss4-like protein [Piptocephalis tieghemiana]|nr:MAG: Mss4-like protein [Piptocephalis tieghemiana]